MFIQIDPRLRAEKMIRLCLPNNVNCSNEMFKILTSTKNHKSSQKKLLKFLQMRTILPMVLKQNI